MKKEKVSAKIYVIKKGRTNGSALPLIVGPTYCLPAIGRGE